MSAAMTGRSWRTGPTSGEKHEMFAATAYMVGSVVLSVGALVGAMQLVRVVA
jgi:hypothetical protein